jgi:hypothetical protein
VDEEHKEEKRLQGEVEDTEEELMIAEHEGLLRWTREERHLAKDASTMQVMLEAEVIAQQLEQQLEDKFNRRRSIRKAWVQEKDEEEVLQTRVVSAEEVRRDLEGWKPIFQKEYEALVSGPVEAITEREVRRMQEEGVKVEILPAKAIASKKPPNRKKGRVVVCGNFAEERDDVNVSVGGVCTMTVRGLLHTAACKHWSVGSIDVTGAFLQAPRRNTTTATIVQPPESSNS